MYLQSKLTKLNKLVTRSCDRFSTSHAHSTTKFLYHRRQIALMSTFSQLAYEYAPKLLSPSQHIIFSRFSFVGHILIHFDSIEHISIFQTPHAYRRLDRQRPGHPRIHWAELTMTHAYQRDQILSSNSAIPHPPSNTP